MRLPTAHLARLLGTRAMALLATALLATAVLAGCGTSDHNDADVAFATGMIPHHAQAVVMSDMAATHSTDPRVLELAAAIKDAQAPEIRTMSGWLRSWDDKVPVSDGSMTSGSAGMGGMAGMLSGSQLADLDAARGADFDRLFLRLMIGHHSGAIDQARDERADGSYGPSLALARTIETSQAKEIVRMKDLLGQS